MSQQLCHNDCYNEWEITKNYRNNNYKNKEIALIRLNLNNLIKYKHNKTPIENEFYNLRKVNLNLKTCFSYFSSLSPNIAVPTLIWVAPKVIAFS